MKISFVSLGCDKNLVDTEHMLYLASRGGYQLVEAPEDADIVVVNSCCFIADALQESIDTIIEIGTLKTTGHLQALILAGCMGQRFSEEIKKELSEVDGIVGTNSYDELLDVIEAALEHKASGAGDGLLDNETSREVDAGVGRQIPVVRKDFTSLPKNEGRVRSTILPYSYLKIAEGCDKRCTYCIIPYIRGGYRSVPMEELLREAEDLAAQGVVELNLVAQEVTRYGIDLHGKKSLPALLTKLSEIGGIERIRLLYCYPEEITDELVEAIRTNPKLCHYIDLPIQHCNDDILKRMGRRTTKAEIRSLVGHLRQEIPDIAIRTTMICGFPGETEEAHQELLEFVEEMDFDRLGAFAYSREEGTPAADFPDQIDDEIKSRWVEEVMSLQQKKVFEKNASLIGQSMCCIVDGKVEDGVYATRSDRDAPDVDGIVFAESDRDYISGTYIDVKITGTSGYDLLGAAEE